MNDAIYGAIALNNVTVYNNYRSPQGMNYQNGQLYLDMGVMMGSGGVMMGSGGSQVQTLSIANFNKIDPTPDFLASPFGTIYNKLTSQNNNFLCLLDKFNNSGTFNLTYLYSSIGMEKPNYDAQTSGSLIIKNKVVFGANLTQQFNPDKIFSVITSGNITKTYERSEIGKVSDIVHEALHAYMNINKIANGATHTAFNDYRNLIINTLDEYNIDNNLGFTATQINEMAFKGTMGSNTVAPSEQFSCYIEGLSNANKTTYSEELKAFNSRLASLNWSLISTTTN